MKFFRDFLLRQRKIKRLTTIIKFLNIFLKNKLFLFSQFCNEDNKSVAYLHFQMKIAREFFGHIQFLKQKLQFLESNPIIDFIAGEERSDGSLKKEEIIFSHGDKWYVITIENLIKMQPTMHLYALKTQKLTAIVMRPNVQDKIISYSLRFEIQMTEGKQILSFDSVIDNFGFDVIKILFSSIKKANIMQCTLDGVLYNIAFDITRNTSSQLILVDPSLRIFFSIGTFNICSCCTQCVPKKQMEEHMEAHIRADRENLMSDISTLIVCPNPNCNAFIDKYKHPIEGEACNHMRCIKCHAAVCYRCTGLRSYPRESILPDPSAFFVSAGRQYAQYFWDSQNRRIEKQVLICPNTCYARHNMCKQLKIVDGMLKRVVCHDNRDIMIDEHEYVEYSTHQQLQDMGIPPEEIEELHQLQVVQDRINPEEFGQ